MVVAEEGKEGEVHLEGLDGLLLPVPGHGLAVQHGRAHPLGEAVLQAGQDVRELGCVVLLEWGVGRWQEEEEVVEEEVWRWGRWRRSTWFLEKILMVPSS